ncbi:hypothetical protein ACFPT7_01140 [Acidicapsa dinghuensis]|uniref:SGNH/GDSL hydrolase family protein n=1 Tax=Acidicapsa dinghuensis TaxID=2218256 RepID=A0ABW1ECA8_9BACT|nr:SGNH/GDSL hydrolase family protein [Acidicapsa dinghuensis]
MPVVTAAIAVLLLLNCALIQWSHRLPYYKKLEQIRIAQNPNLLFVGNSLLDHHVNETAFEQAAAAHGANWIALNSALGASLAPEQRLLFQYAETCHPTITTVVIGFYDFQLTDTDHSHVADLVGNRIIGVDHRFPLSETAAAYNFGMISRAELELVRSVPMAAYRANAWKDVEILRRRMAAVGMPQVAINSMGRVDDFTALEADSTQRFDEEAQTFLAAPERFNVSFEAILAEARQANMHVVLLAMPMSPYHLKRFYSRPSWSAYFSALKRLASTRNIQIVDASTWMPDESDFADHLHLSPQAVSEFSMRLGISLAHAEIPQAKQSAAIHSPS